MLFTKEPKTTLACIHQARFNKLTHELKLLIDASKQEQYFNEFYSDLYDFIYDFYMACENKKLIYIEQIIEQFYTKWLYSNIFPNKISSGIDYAITAALTPLIMLHLAVQLAYVSHYSVNVTYGLTILYVTVGIKITTPQWISVGTLNSGVFCCKIIKSRQFQSRTHRIKC